MRNVYVFRMVNKWKVCHAVSLDLPFKWHQGSNDWKTVYSEI
jgi:hypothetical protein